MAQTMIVKLFTHLNSGDILTVEAQEGDTLAEVIAKAAQSNGVKLGSTCIFQSNGRTLHLSDKLDASDKVIITSPSKVDGNN